MSKAGDAIDVLNSVWGAVKKSKPEESDFSQWNYAGLSFDALDLLFANWGVAINSWDKKDSWLTPEVAIFQRPLADGINDLASFLSGHQSNGFAWMLDSGLMAKIQVVQNQINTISSGKNSVSKELAKILADSSKESAERVVAAGKVANKVVEGSAAIEDIAGEAEEAITAIQGHLSGVSATAEVISSVASDVKARAASVEDGVEQIQAAHLQVEELKRRADSRESELEERVASLDKAIVASKAEAESALLKVQQALREARNEGLAKAFQDRSDILKAERRLWTITFIGAVLILGALSIVFTIELTEITYQALIVTLLRKVALSAPAVWLGWYSAKQIGRVSRVQEDYEYKCATALAFQSYKDEVKLGGDSDMLNRLLGTAIETFGENPVRLYDDAKAESVSPAEALLKNVKPDQMTDVLGAILDIARKRVS